MFALCEGKLIFYHAEEKRTYTIVTCLVHCCVTDVSPMAHVLCRSKCSPMQQVYYFVLLLGIPSIGRDVLVAAEVFFF